MRWSSSGYVCAVGGMQQQHPTSHRAWAACLRGQGTGLMKIVLVFLGVAADGQPPLPQWSLEDAPIFAASQASRQSSWP